MSADPPIPPHEPAPRPSPQATHPLEEQRRKNRDAARALGFDPYGRRPEGDGPTPLAQALRLYDPAADEAHKQGHPDARPVVTIAGRVVLLRDNGKLVWMTLRDHTGDLQIAVSARDAADERTFELAKLTDLGDIVLARGPLVRTRTGEVTVWCKSLWPAAKSLTPPPDKHAGLTDPELRYRQRYTDMWVNPETARVLAARSAIVAAVRAHLTGAGYTEVETPMLQPLAGGAAARPFVTRMNALGIDLSLRIAPELYLKRLLVGGLPRIFEINRNFRNEGLDRRHNPEFTMLELYHAFGDMHTVMEVTESLVRHCAAMFAPAPGSGPLTLPFGDHAVDYGPPFGRVRYAELFGAALGFDMADTARARAHAAAHHVPHQGLDDWLVVNQLFERFAEPTLDPARPTFITHYPAAVSPLTRPNPDDPTLADRADLFIGGMEIAPHYTELNDPDLQAAIFRQQLAGQDDEESTFRTYDHDFIDALKVGMPPAGGMGLGIDRLVMLLTNQRSIRDVILFPLMRPLA